MGSDRLDVSVAILALALPFALPVLIVASIHPSVVATPSTVVAAPGAVAATSVAPYELRTANPTVTSQPAGAGSPTRAPDASPVVAPAPVPATSVPATHAPASTAAPASPASPALGPTLTQPPTATEAGPREVAADPSLFTGFLLLGGLGVVFVTMGRRQKG